MIDARLILGAVAYAPKVVTIWDGFKEYFERGGLSFDYILYSNYERQVDGLLAGECDVAWNSPLAWIQSERLARSRGRQARALAMRDTDRDLASVVVVGADSPAWRLADLRGRRVAVGAADSPQATLIPLFCLAEAGLLPDADFQLLRHDRLRGKHGDHIGGEREAARALAQGAVEAACMIEGNYALFVQEGTIPDGSTRVLACSPRYDHCNFTILDGVPESDTARFRELLLGMSHEDPGVRNLLDLEGLRSWMEGRESGYDMLGRAADKLGILDDWWKQRQSGGAAAREAGPPAAPR